MQLTPASGMTVLSANPQHQDQVCCSHTSMFPTTWYLRAAQPGDFNLTVNMKGQWSSDSRVKYDKTNTTTIQVLQQVQNPNLTISVSPTIAPTQSDVTITGQLIGAASPTPVTLYLTRPDNSTISTQVTTDSHGGYSYTFKPERVGVWQAQTHWEGHGGSAIESFIVKIPTSLSIVAYPNQATYGTTISVWGNLQNSANYTGIGNKLITITYTVDNSTWTTLTTAETTSNGRYRETWMPDAGVYWLMASFPGDFQAIESSSSQVQLIVTKDSSLLTIDPITATRAGETVNITGTLTSSRGNPLPSKTIELTALYEGSTSWTYLATVTTDEEGLFTYPAWVMQGNATLRATWSGDPNHLGQTTNQTVTLMKIPTTTSIQLSPSQIEANNPVNITGQAQDGDGNPINGTINLQYSMGSDQWVDIGTATTNSTGYYLYTWTPTAEGSYTVRASYQTTAIYASSASQANLTVTQSPLGKIIDIFTKDRFLGTLMTVAIIVIVVVILAAVFLIKPKRSDGEPEDQQTQ